MSPNPEYVLGDGQRELQRLALQAQFWGGATLELLKRARIGPGMRVLDLGCGAGDVSLLAATLVGSSGSIVGIDRSPAAVEAARAKVEAAALANVEFHVAAIEDFAADRPFDALIGRFVLMYFSDPVATLRQLLPLVRSRGVVAFLEMDIDAARTVPRVAVVETALERLRDTFRRAGIPVDFGPQVWRIFPRRRAPRAGIDRAFQGRTGASAVRDAVHCGDGEKPVAHDGAAGRGFRRRGRDRDARGPYAGSARGRSGFAAVAGSGGHMEHGDKLTGAEGRRARARGAVPMIDVYRNDTDELIGSITDADLQVLVDGLEEETADDQDYWIDKATIDVLGDGRATEHLLGIFRKALGSSDGVGIRWERRETGRLGRSPPSPVQLSLVPCPSSPVIRQQSAESGVQGLAAAASILLPIFMQRVQHHFHR